MTQTLYEKAELFKKTQLEIVELEKAASRAKTNLENAKNLSGGLSADLGNALGKNIPRKVWTIDGYVVIAEIVGDDERRVTLVEPQRKS